MTEELLAIRRKIADLEGEVMLAGFHGSSVEHITPRLLALYKAESDILRALMTKEIATRSADPRPHNCRFRLKDEGKVYPRSACSGCHKTIFTGLGLGCTVTEPLMRDNFPDDEDLAPAPVVVDWKARAEATEKLIDLLCLADEAIMQEHGCFPLDRTNERQVFLNDACMAIRSITGDDYQVRKDRAARALVAAAKEPRHE